MAGVTPTARRVLFALWVVTRVVATAVLITVVAFGAFTLAVMAPSRRRY